MLAMLPTVGFVEIFMIFLFLIFWAIVIAVVVKLFQRSANNRMIATLVEENRRLREEIAALKGEKTYVEPEV
jgi:cell division protein FtsB